MVDALVDTLRARVLDGHLPPGAVLVEADIATEFGISRPTARTAITQLVHEGLLRRQPHKSAHVPVLSRADVEDLFLVRIPLELGVVGAVVAQGAPRPKRRRGRRRPVRPCPTTRRTACSSTPTSTSTVPWSARWPAPG